MADIADMSLRDILWLHACYQSREKSLPEDIAKRLVGYGVIVQIPSTGSVTVTRDGERWLAELGTIIPGERR